MRRFPTLALFQKNLMRLADISRKRGTSRFRICLHNSTNENIQEMIMFIFDFGKHLFIKLFELMIRQILLPIILFMAVAMYISIVKI